MPVMLWELLTNPWWIYDPETASFWGHAYRWFNLLEGTVWTTLAMWVLLRHGRRTRIKWCLALALIAFGLSDFREARIQSASLVAVKGVILLTIVFLRHQFVSQAIVRQSTVVEKSWREDDHLEPTTE